MRQRVAPGADDADPLRIGEAQLRFVPAQKSPFSSQVTQALL